jgi:hypothetical protein
MTASEWLEITARMRAFWPRAPLPDHTLALWFDELRDHSADEVLAAVTTWHRDGQEWPPHSGQILGKLADLAMDARPFGEVWALVRQAVSSYGARSPRALEWLESQDARAAQLARDIGIRTIGAADEGDRTLFAQARDVYAGIVRRERRGLTYTGLPAPQGLRELERVSGHRRSFGTAGGAIAAFIEEAKGQ